MVSLHPRRHHLTFSVDVLIKLSLLPALVVCRLGGASVRRFTRTLLSSLPLCGLRLCDAVLSGQYITWR